MQTHPLPDPYGPAATAPAPTAHRRPWARAVAVVLALEVGLLLLTLPWTPLWAHSFWIARLGPAHPQWLRALLSPALRGAVSGLGLVNLWMASSAIAHSRP